MIVPNVPDEPTTEQVKQWGLSSPKEYKIRVLNPDAKTMNMPIMTTDKLWKEVDGKLIEFRSDFRPRAQYLYFAYCAAMLRRSFAGKQLQVSKSELRKKYWETPGKYMRESMLLGFVEQMGHDYDHLLEGKIEEENAVADIRCLDAANNAIQDSLKGEENDEDSDEESDDCEGEIDEGEK